MASASAIPKSRLDCKQDFSRYTLSTLGQPGSYDDYQKKYEEIQEIGKGAYSVVSLIKERKARPQDDTAYVSKITYLSTRPGLVTRRKHEAYTLTEIKVYHGLQGMDLKSGHDHVLKMLGWYAQLRPDGREMDIIVEIFEKCHCDLFQRVIEEIDRPLTEDEARPVITEIAQGLRFLHDNNVVHRDLKLENVLCVHPTNLTPIKICDFNISQYRGKDQRPSPMNSPTGTLNILDPLRLSKQLKLGEGTTLKIRYSRKCDAWALGAVMYTLLTAEDLLQDDCHCGDMGCPAVQTEPKSGVKTFKPFLYQDCHDCMKKNLEMRCKPVFVDSLAKVKGCSISCKDFLQGLLELHEDDRFSMNEVVNHNWIDHNYPLVQRTRRSREDEQINPTRKKSFFSMLGQAYNWLTKLFDSDDDDDDDDNDDFMEVFEQ